MLIRLTYQTKDASASRKRTGFAKRIGRPMVLASARAPVFDAVVLAFVRASAFRDRVLASARTVVGFASVAGDPTTGRQGRLGAPTLGRGRLIWRVPAAPPEPWCNECRRTSHFAASPEAAPKPRGPQQSVRAAPPEGPKGAMPL
ncbi:unnamed protein product [Prorocentrum cordatum]|uniref:Uncharacterized protein n=1 Tax=Prorocentrum cordatum TaxID=2364126 RepID=A0ABN9S230_9DINO|nr:unnamed protein product [Polarella glacialis]